MKKELMEFVRRYIGSTRTCRILIPLSHDLKSRIAGYAYSNNCCRADVFRIAVLWDLEQRIIREVRQERDLRARVLLVINTTINEDLSVRTAELNFSGSESVSAYIRECVYQFLETMEERSEKK